MKAETIGVFPGSLWENRWIRQNIPADTVCPIPYMNVSTAESRLLRLFLLLHDPVEIWDIKIKNTGEKQRSISVFSYLEFSFHQIEMDNKNFQMSLYAAGSSYKDGVIEHDLFMKSLAISISQQALFRTVMTVSVTDSWELTAQKVILQE